MKAIWEVGNTRGIELVAILTRDEDQNQSKQYLGGQRGDRLEKHIQGRLRERTAHGDATRSYLF